MRTIDNSVSIEMAFERMVSELSTFGSSGGLVKTQGHPALLKTVVFDEIYRIGREAYVNAVTHAAAKQIGIAVEYGIRSFRLRVSDDGRGIDIETFTHGREGHWGLAGMRERAKAIGADLSIHTHTPGGTTIELRIPAAIAYLSTDSHRIRWPRKIRKRHSETRREFHQ